MTPSTRSEPVQHRSRLLLVDDEDAFRLSIKNILRDEDFEIDDASRGEDAIRLARTNTYDLILLDIDMPVMDGVQVLKILHPELPSTDFIMVTGYQETWLAVDSMKFGAKEYVTKPVDPGDLIQRIKSSLRARAAELRLKTLQLDFSSRLLHDLRTPLNTMRSAIGFLEKKLAGPITQEQHEVLSDMERNIEKLSAILNDMIDLTLFESGQVELLKLPTNMDELIPSICAQMKPLAQAKGVALSINANGEIPTVEVDPDKIEQVLTNLIDNATRFTAPGGTINVSLAAVRYPLNGTDRECIETSVRDTGSGIPPEEMPYIFDKYKEFITGRTSQSKTTGLGLAICKSIIEAHHGAITADSVPNQGSSFRFYIPVDPD